MTKYSVIITPAAELDAEEAFEYIRERSPMNAIRWLRETIAKLEQFAGYGRAPEAELLGRELRQVVFKSHRIVFSVKAETKTVFVHYVVHAARRRLGEDSRDEGAG